MGRFPLGRVRTAGLDANRVVLLREIVLERGGDARLALQLVAGLPPVVVRENRAGAVRGDDRGQPVPRGLSAKVVAGELERVLRVRVVTQPEGADVHVRALCDQVVFVIAAYRARTGERPHVRSHARPAIVAIAVVSEELELARIVAEGEAL